MESAKKQKYVAARFPRFGHNAAPQTLLRSSSSFRYASCYLTTKNADALKMLLKVTHLVLSLRVLFQEQPVKENCHTV